MKTIKLEYPKHIINHLNMVKYTKEKICKVWQ